MLFSFCADGSEGGINIEEAKRRMREADVTDKETYRAQLKRRKQVRIAMNDVMLRRDTVDMRLIGDFLTGSEREEEGEVETQD